MAKVTSKLQITLPKRIAEKHGIAPGDMIGQLSENRREWIVADLAIQTAGAVHVPLHAALSAEQAAAQLQHAEVKLIFVSTREQLQKLATVAERLNPALTIVLFDKVEPQERTVGALATLSFDEFVAGITPDNAQDVQQNSLDTLTPDDLANFLGGVAMTDLCSFAVDKHGMTAKLGHPGLKAGAGTGAGEKEQHSQHLVC